MSSSVTWTFKDDKVFESAVATSYEDTPEWYEKVAKEVGGGKTAADVKLHYEKLVDDVASIEAGLVPLPKYKKHHKGSTSGSSIKNKDDKEKKGKERKA